MSIQARTSERRSSVTKKLKRRSKAAESSRIELPGHNNQRVFLYMHLKDIQHLPETSNELVLRLEQSKNSITQMVDIYTTSTDINLTKTYERGEPVPTFSVMIDQDSIEDLNIFSDNPLVITLYDYIPPPEEHNSEQEQEQEQEEEDASNEELPSLPERVTAVSIVEVSQDELEDEERWTALAQGHIDLLQFFTTSRNNKSVDLFIYPLRESDTTVIATLKTTWDVYSLLPLVKSISFENIAFISLEAIYQVADQLMQSEIHDIVVDLSFQSLKPNAHQKLDRVKICSFSYLTKEVVGDQNPNIKWESIKREPLHNIHCLGIQFGNQVDVFGLFRDLVKAEDTEFDFDQINMAEDAAFVCNAVHRYVLTKDMIIQLENALASNEQEILIELYRVGRPNNVLLQGSFDLSIFLYPKVNFFRFAVELREPPPPTTPQRKNTLVPKGLSTAGTTSKPSTPLNTDRKTRESLGSNDKKAFAIINIGLLTPITEQTEIFPNATSSHKDQMPFFTPIVPKSVVKSPQCIKEEAYSQYDEIICSLLDVIVRKNIRSVSDLKSYFCCQISNMINKLTKIIAYDFNLRVSTENNIEFTNLMTMVYGELMQRHSTILKRHDDLTQFDSNIINEKKSEILSYFNAAKYLLEVGDTVLAEHVLNKITKENPYDSGLSFYKFIYDVEKCNYDSARRYLDRPRKDKEYAGDYFTLIVDIYIEYASKLAQDEPSDDPFEQLLVRLQDFLNIYQLEVDCWVLLHCLYKVSAYLPGMSYTRWRYESLLDKPRKNLPVMAKSLWELYHGSKLNLTTKKSKLFNSVFEMFLKLGLYKFAEVIFIDIAEACSTTEKYFILTTLKILQNDVEKKYTVKQFPTNKSPEGDIINASQKNVNGNLEFYRLRKEEAMLNYGEILTIPTLEDLEDFQLSLLRYGYYMLEQKKFRNAEKAFKKCSTTAGIGLAVNKGLGKAMYGLGQLDEAEHYFAQSTKYRMHTPDAWAYLALIHLKKGNNFKALECWKYAKIHPEDVISEEILDELTGIDYSSVDLYVDIPEA